MLHSRSRQIYLAGPMRGIPKFNYPKFNAVAASLRNKGHRVYNPAEFPWDENDLHNFPLRKAFAAMTEYICLEACTIVLLDGWEGSEGANAELSLAKICSLEIIFWDERYDC